ncbi:MAG: UTP--glucose-1-phosphate uridylyltransferase [Simkaniaceae bacterium]|nr:UTP--glucose-1-phosphate uridylyltransferase [Simkaniaceae bacterium]
MSQELFDQIVALGQEHIFYGKERDPHKFETLLKKLAAIAAFYKNEGGLAGYANMAKQVVEQGKDKEVLGLYPPEVIPISEWTEEVEQAVHRGIELLPYIAEIYPVGGAAERLNTGLPAARFEFLGKNLLTRVIEDLQAREQLYFERYGVEILTPIAMMTSEVGDNHEHVINLCKEAHYFGRPKELFFFFKQPLVPTFDRTGKWHVTEPLTLDLKPNGHGVIWKLARENGVFDWLKKLGRTHALVRQINNPVASTDYGILALMGYSQGKSMGFASCPRLVHAKEGMNIKKAFKDRKALSNIEYCDLKRYGISDEPRSPDSKYSQFPSNTNILFIDLQRIEEASEKMPYPGLIVNFSKDKTHTRLESTMQNIADILDEAETYITYNIRRKTISTTKKRGHGDLETPEQCQKDMLENARELLGAYCQMKVPSNFSFHMHPALGPLWNDIRHKIHGGSLSEGSSLILEIGNLLLEDVHIEGSLTIIGEAILKTSLGDQSCCRLKNLSIKGDVVIRVKKGETVEMCGGVLESTPLRNRD